MAKMEWRKAKDLKIEKREKLKQHPKEKQPEAIKRNKKKNKQVLAEYEQMRVTYSKIKGCTQSAL